MLPNNFSGGGGGGGSFNGSVINNDDNVALSGINSGNGVVLATLLSAGGSLPAPNPTNGTTGNDTLVGGSGDDHLSGGKGNDFLVGGAGQDVLRGGQGDDILIGELGNDVLHGGRENDILLHSAGDGQDTITGFQNGDRLELEGYTLGLNDLNFANLDTNNDGLIGKGDNAATFTQHGDLVLVMAGYGAGVPDTVTLKGVAFLHSSDVAVT